MRVLSLLCLAVIMVIASPTAYADLIASAEIVDTIGDPHRITIMESMVDTVFSFDVWLTTNFDAMAAEMKVQSLDGSGVFELTGRTFDEGEGWGYFPLEFTGPDDLTRSPDDASSQLIGCLSVADFVSPGSLRYMTVDAVVKAGTTPGIYGLNLVNINLGTYSGGLDVTGSAGQAYEVEIIPVPAPGAVVLGAMGLSMVGWVRRRFTKGDTFTKGNSGTGLAEVL